jgi:hypothetical protein
VNPAQMFGQPVAGQHGSDVTVGLPAVPSGPVLHSPPPLGQERHTDAGQSAVDQVAVSVRNQAINRMEVLSRNHARLALESPGPPICPHAIAFLYLDTVPAPMLQVGQTPWRKVVAATRIVPDTPDVRDLPTLLFRLARLAKQRYLPTPGGFDPAVHMSVYRDETTGRAEYIGVGVSTLDTPDMRWEQACATAEDTDDLGGRMYVLLADHTAILIDRPPPRRGRRDLGVHSTGNLNFRDALAPRLWTGHRDVSTMPVEPEIWDLLNELHQAAYQQNPRPTL